MTSDGAPITLSVQPAQAGQTFVATAKPATGKPSPSGSAAGSAATAAAATRAPNTAAPNAAAPDTAASKAAAPAALIKATASASVFSHAAAGAAPVAKTTPPVTQRDLGTFVNQLNKHLNDSGRPDQYRVDPQSSTTIQEINPANGEVIGEFSASEFPALARSAGAAATGLLVDSVA